MYVADNLSSFTKGDTLMGCKTVGLHFMHNNLIFEIALMCENYECLIVWYCSSRLGDEYWIGTYTDNFLNPLSTH